MNNAMKYSGIITIILCVVFILAYTYVLYKITGRKRNSRNIFFAFLGILLGGIFVHMALFKMLATTEDLYTNVILRFLFATKFSFEMFLASTVVFKEHVFQVLEGCHCLLYSYFTLFFAAILTSAFAIFHFLPRRWFNFIWLSTNRHKAVGRKSHIFVGINPASLYLVKDLQKKCSDEEIIFIDVPEEQDYPRVISVWDFVTAFLKENKEKANLDDYVVLKAGKGLGKIHLWLQNKENKIYFLSENQNRNLMMLDDLLKYGCSNCHIYCHAKKEGLVNRYDTLADLENQITIIDSSYLAVEFMKKDDSCELLPVKYVDVAEKDGCKLGYVTSDFNCAVIGFGETGREALKFLYEYGAFPGEDKLKSPFRCHVFDKDSLSYCGSDCMADYRDPDAAEDEVVFHALDVNRADFWKEMKTLITKLNYMVICLGDDKLNMQVAIDLAEFAVTSGRDVSDKFIIAVKQMETTPLLKITLESAKSAFMNCIKEFGLSEDIWKIDVISNEVMSNEAAKFYTSYALLSEEIDRKVAEENNYEYKQLTWEERNKLLESVDYSKRCNIRRQVAQDYSNCMHKTTKRSLCSLGQEASDEVLSINNGKEHSVGPNADVLEYLAIGEHLRWNASQIIMGYKYHKNLKPYSQLDECTRHYDWLVVKNSLM